MLPAILLTCLRFRHQKGKMIKGKMDVLLTETMWISEEWLVDGERMALKVGERREKKDDYQ
jgi:hypothetical protein